MAGRRVNPVADTLAADSLSPLSSTGVGAELVAGRYEIQALLGRGGMGHVYRARDRELDEVVALKRLHRDLLHSEEMTARFRQEVKLARRVSHRNVARTFDIGEHGGERFLTMELVEGESLASRLAREGALPAAEAVRIARDVCAGMAAAHEAGVVHRDLKPDNVLMTADGRVVVTDFGIARGHLPGDVGQTNGGAVGTPAYMAPEQVCGEEVDGRADIYALGATLYELLTGERAWPGDAPFHVAAARLTEPPPDPRERRADLDAPLAEIVRRCLARDAKDRFTTATELEGALEHVRASLREERPAALLAPKRAESGRGDLAVLVLPFKNAGPADDAYLAEGLTDDLIDVLATTPRLRVKSAGRAAGPRDGDSADSIGRRLGVDVVVEGSVRRIGDAVRVGARLVGVDDGFHIWASRFERPMTAVFSLNDEVARAVATALSTKLGAPKRADVTDPVAIDLYLRGRAELGRFWSLRVVMDAKAKLREAARLAPDDPTIVSEDAMAGLAGLGIANVDISVARTQIARALELAPARAEPYVALASLRWNAEEDPARAVGALRRALELAPSSASAHDLLGRILLEVGSKAARHHLETALWLDPSTPFARVDLMRIAAYDTDWERVEELARTASDAQTNIHYALVMARFAQWLGRPLDVVRYAEALPSDADERIVIGARAQLEVVRTGAIGPDGRRMLAQYARLKQQTRLSRLFTQIAAELTAMAGEDDAAMGFVREVVEAGLLDVVWITKNPLLARVRARPEFAPLAAEVARRAACVVEAFESPLDGPHAFSAAELLR